MNKPVISNSMQAHQREIAAVCSTNALHRSRNASPARSVRSLRAGFQQTEASATPSSISKFSPDTERRRSGKMHNELPAQSNQADSKGTAVGENEICNSTLETSKNDVHELASIKQSDFVSAFSKPRASSNSISESKSPFIGETGKDSNPHFDTTSPEDKKVENTVTIQDHVASFSKVSDANKKLPNCNETGASSGRRQRERKTANRSQCLQLKHEKKDQRAEDATKTGAQYVPTYISPVGTGLRPKDADAVALHTGNSHGADKNLRHQIIQNERKRTSSSGDSSNNETQSHVQLLRSSFDNKGKLTPDTSDNETEIFSGRRSRRQRTQNRNINYSHSGSTHTPDYSRVTSPNTDGYSAQVGTQIQPGQNTHGSQKPEVASRVHQRRAKYKKQFFEEVDEKYSTLPADFRPNYAHVGSGHQAQTNFHRSNSSMASIGDCNKNHSGTILDHKPGVTEYKSNLKKVGTAQRNQLLKFPQHSRNRLDQTKTAALNQTDVDTATVHQNATMESRPLYEPHKVSQQVGHLRNLFNSPEIARTEFGKTSKKNTQQAKRDGLVTHMEVPTRIESRTQVVHSQPTLTVRKLSEDYWPRDEATEKLLNPGSTQPHPEIILSTDNDLRILKDNFNDQSTVDRNMQITGNTNHEDNVINNNLDPLCCKNRNSSDFQSEKENLTITIPSASTSDNAETLIVPAARGSQLSPKRRVRRHSRSRSREIKQDEHIQSPSSTSTCDDSDKKLRFDHSKNNKKNDGDLVIGQESNVLQRINVDNFRKLPSSMHNATITQAPHVIPALNSKFHEVEYHSKQEDELLTPTNELEGCSIACNECNFSNSKISTRTISQSSASSESAIPPTISTSTRKTSVVSQSTALPRKKSLIGYDSSTETGEIDEGCYIEDDNLVQPVVTRFSFPDVTFNQSEEKSHASSVPLNRRRRKFSSPQQNTSDSNSNTNSVEPSVRSLSDPISNHTKSFNSRVEESAHIDSTLKALSQSERSQKQVETGRNNSASDISTYSENASTQEEYDDRIQYITSDPHDIGGTKVEFNLKEKKYKILKKKSRSDPNASAVILARLLMVKPGTDLQLAHLYHSSSEPTLLERENKSENFMPIQSSQEDSSSTECANDDDISQDTGYLTKSIEDMSKSLLTNSAITARSYRRSATDKTRKRAEFGSNQAHRDKSKNHRLPIAPSLSPIDNPFEQEEEQFYKICEEMTTVEKTSNNSVVHSRSCSEPAGVDNMENILVKKVSEQGRRAGIVQAPSFDAGMMNKPSNLTINKPLFGGSVDRILPATLPRTANSHGLDYQSYIGRQDKLDMRKHVVMNLLETEDSYVKSLRILYENYLKPLKRPENHTICEPRLVDVIFFQIPVILQHHEKFFENVRNCFENWHYGDVKMGDIFMQSFNKDMLLESYTSYIKNYMNAREAVNIAIESKSTFKLFLEQCKRENKDKQGLFDLMIQPVQRIPRYELIIKDLLKHTAEEHPDSESLLVAQKEIHALSVQMNKGERDAKVADNHFRLLQDIEQIVEGCMDLSSPSMRKFLHQDFCVELRSANKKDRSLWLLSDLLMCTTSKKGKSATIRRSSMNIFAMSSDRVMVDFSSKYKFLWKYPLEDVELLKGSTGPNQQAVEKQLQQLRSDQDLLLQLEDDAAKLTCNHALLDDTIRDLIVQTEQQIADREQQISMQSMTLPGRLEIGISTLNGMKLHQFEFPSEESKSQFELLFWNAKRSCTSPIGRHVPAFMKAIPISKTRNGMQFSCAAPNVDTSPGTREVWVCNTDGYVGQICFLTLDPEPSQTICITVCNSKICCIEQVPPWDRKLVPTNKFLYDVSTAPLNRSVGDRRRSSGNSNRALTIMAFDSDVSDEDNTSPLSTTSNYSMSPYSTNNSPSNCVRNSTTCVNENKDNDVEDWGIDSDEEIILPIMSPLIPNALLIRKFGFADTPSTNIAIEDSTDTANPTGGNENVNILPPNIVLPQNSFMHALMGSGAFKKDNDGFTHPGSLEDLLADQPGKISKRNKFPEEKSVGKHSAASKQLSSNGSMWLGTEDGGIKVYSTVEAIRGSKHCVQLNHHALIQCILYHQGQVFVALGNGDLVIYSRNMTNGQWEFDNKKIISLGTTPQPITKMVIVGDKELWCGCQGQIMILDMTFNAKSQSQNHNVKSFFSVSQDIKRQVQCMACCSYGVWIALDKRAQIKLYHTVTHDLLTDIDISQPVSKMLASSDAIIRQHKAACLRITSLLVCKDLLWVGTSAGVVLTMALPNITETTTSLSLPIIPQGLAYGHTGHVRFLTSVETTEKDITSSRGGRQPSLPKRRLSSTSASNQLKTLVISGGDGYEDFRMNAASEGAGREDSTNHLLVWKV